jgi:hypothetical protein
MKFAFGVGLSCMLLVACASAPSPVSSSPSLTAGDGAGGLSDKTAAEAWAESKVVAEMDEMKRSLHASAFDPLSTKIEHDDGTVPQTEMTPPSALRKKTATQLKRAAAVAKSAASVDVAVKKLTKRLGKPSWTESQRATIKRRVWVASAGQKCHRLTLEADGAVEVETASQTGWRVLADSAKQNACSGEIRRTISLE